MKRILFTWTKPMIVMMNQMEEHQFNFKASSMETFRSRPVPNKNELFLWLWVVYLFLEAKRT